MKLPEGAWVAVADGERHLLLANAGPPTRIDLRVVEAGLHPAQRTAALGADRPGRTWKVGERRSSFEGADWSRLGKESHAVELVARLDRAAAAGDFAALVIVADPRTLGVLRPLLGAPVRAALLAEIVGDHTHDTVEAIEALVERY